MNQPCKLFTQSQDHYNRHANDYNQWVTHSPTVNCFYTAHSQLLSHVGRLGISFADSEVFDFGAGQGRDSAEFLRIAAPNCAAYEPNPAMRTHFHRNAPQLRCWTEEQFRDYMETVHDGDPGFDIMWSSAVLQHLGLDELINFIICAKSSIRVGGYLIATRRLTPYAQSDDRPFVPLLTDEVIPHWNSVTIFNDSKWKVLVDDREAMDGRRGCEFQNIIIKRIK